jgi:hypothetical protein
MILFGTGSIGERNSQKNQQSGFSHDKMMKEVNFAATKAGQTKHKIRNYLIYTI